MNSAAGDASMVRWLQDMFPRDDYVAYWELCDRLHQRALRDGLGALSPTARTILLAERYDAGMAKAGWYSLVSWDDYDLMAMIPALEAVGATSTAEVLRDLAGLFPEGVIPPAVSERTRQYQTHVMQREERLGRLEDRLHAADENVARLTEQFAIVHREELREEEAVPHVAADPTPRTGRGG